jgi:hypothetical protein
VAGAAIYETKPFFARHRGSPAGTSTLVALEGRQSAPSFARFSAIQGIERKQDLAPLASKGCFISAEAIEGEVGQIGET